LAFLFVSCSSSVRVIVEETKSDLPKQQNISYKNFHDSFEHLDTLFAVNSEQKGQQFMQNALKCMIRGSYDEAEAILKEQKELFNNDTLKSFSFKLLSSIYAIESRWDEASNLLHENGGTDAEDIYKVYAEFPTEKTIWNKESDTAKLRYSKGNPIIEVELNGKKYKFIFDTGADMSVVSSDVAKECGLKLKAGFKNVLKNANDGSVGFYSSVADTLKIASTAFYNHPVFVINEKDLKFKFLFFTVLKIDGIIGWNLIKQIRVVLDFKNEQLILTKPEKKSNFERNLFWVGYPYLKCLSDGNVVLNMGFDTGADMSAFTLAIFDKISPRKLDECYRKVYSVAGETEYKGVVMPELKLLLADKIITFNNIYSVPERIFKKFIIDGVIGGDVLENTVTEIDFINGTFRIYIIK
ncbi:MAG: retropepsin-like aspartic protease, partial [Bacteroidota bacterium]